MGGSQLGTSHAVPAGPEIEAVARTLRMRRVDGLLVIGGWSAYEAAQRLHAARDEHEALNIPIICMPAAIDNNLPGTEISIGADTALNTIAEQADLQHMRPIEQWWLELRPIARLMNHLSDPASTLMQATTGN